MAQQRTSSGAMTVAEAGRRGRRLVREKYGPRFYEKIGKKGGRKVADLIERGKTPEEQPPEPGGGERAV